MNESSGPVCAVLDLGSNSFHLLKGVSLSVQEGSIVALLGGNGAGKTTTLRAVSSLLKGERGEVTKGSVDYNGERVDAMTPADLVKRRRRAGTC